MLKTYKTEIDPTEEQKQKINQSMGVCRWLYNQYLWKNKQLYEKFKNGEIDKKESFIRANDFDKYINNEIKVLEEYKWINSCGSKARKKAIQNAETSYKRFFKGLSRFPRLKKKNKSNMGLYFPKNAKNDWYRERHRIQIPTIGMVKIKEFGYIPTDKKVVSGTITMKAGKYYVAVLIETDDKNNIGNTNEGIGIDLGVKDFAICSNGEIYKNINKKKEVKRLENKLLREQRKLSRKYESLKIRNKIEKEVATRQNIQKQIAIVQRLYHRLFNIRNNYINYVISELLKQKPSYITLEDLNVKGMMKNRHLAKAVSKQNFYSFRNKLEYKCKWNGIELRIVDRFYPSSKTCHECGSINKQLKLSEREYICEECGCVIDRDLNASLNLRDCQIYKVA